MENQNTALDTEILENIGLVQPEDESDAGTQEEEVSVETQIDEGEQPTPNKLEIEGIGDVTLEEIKEWRQGNLRHSDYTKKTQELARQREENETAIELFNYLQQNPNILETLKAIDEQGVVNQNIVSKASPESAMMREIWYKQKEMEVDRQVEALKQKYGDIDEVALFNTARELKINDLEKVFKIISYDNKPLGERELIEKAKEELRAELLGVKATTKTIVSQGANKPVATKVNLSDAEKRMASVYGMTEEEYSKWKD